MESILKRDLVDQLENLTRNRAVNPNKTGKGNVYLCCSMNLYISYNFTIYFITYIYIFIYLKISCILKCILSAFSPPFAENSIKEYYVFLF